MLILIAVVIRVRHERVVYVAIWSTTPLRHLSVVLLQELLDAAQNSIESGSGEREKFYGLVRGARSERASDILNQGDLAKVVTLTQRTHQLKRARAIGLLPLEAALYLALFNDKEVVTLVILVEHIFTWAHLHHFQSID